jgi:hypothetical protein
MPFGGFEDFDECVQAQISKGKDSEEAKKICGSLQAKAEGSTAETFEDNGKFYIKAFLLDSSVNKNSWGVDNATLQQNINSYIGKPLVLQDDFQHPDSGDPNFDHVLQFQEKFRIGNIIDIVNKDSMYSAIIEVTDPIAKQAFQHGELPLTVSPQLYHDAFATEPEGAMTKWRGTHLAVVKEPAYGVTKARVHGQCSGSPMNCLAQLKRASVDQNHCNCVKQAITNYTKSASRLGQFTIHPDGTQTLRFYGKGDSSLDKKVPDTSKLDVQNNANPPTLTVKEELEKVQRERDEYKAKVAALEGTNQQVSEENKSLSASLNSLQGEYRKDKVTALLSAVFYKTDEERSKAIESFTKSNMSYDEIVSVTSPLKKANVNQSQETKLQVKSASTEENEVPYWARIEQQIVGDSA